MTSLVDLADRAVPMVVGAKAANLAALSGRGFSVPAGVVVTNAEPTEEELAGFFEMHRDRRFAVRSSAIGEDGVTASMAGRYRSFLNVEASAVLDAIRRCRAHAAAESLSIEPIPVLVQVMVEAQVAGVAFSADPITGDRNTVVVEGVRGLADRLVAGREPGDEFEVAGRRVRQRRSFGHEIPRSIVREAARLAVAASEAFGDPQDVEWASDGDRLWMIQSRPITALPPAADWSISERGVFHRGFRFGEWISEPVTPLFESWLLTTMERTLHEVHRREVGQFGPEPHHVIVNGWYFYSLNFLPVPGGSLLRSLPRVLRNAITAPRRVAVMFPQTVRAGYPTYEADWRNELHPRFVAAVDQADAQLVRASGIALVELVDRLAALCGEYFASIAVVAGSTYKVETLLGQLWNRRLRDRLGFGFQETLIGLHGPIVSGQPLLASLDWAVPVETATGENEDRRSELAARRESALAAARRALGTASRVRRQFDDLVAHAQHLQPIREEQMAGLARAWPVMRTAVLALANELRNEGVLEQADDVFFMTKAELEQALRSGQPMHGTITKRRADHHRASQLVPPETVGQMPMMTKVAFATTNRAVGAKGRRDALLTGVPASAGTATGTARLVRTTQDLAKVGVGDVIVSPITAPAWTPALARAAALVTDIGSGLAHGSIMAREFGIPAVVGTGDATRRVADGTLITVNGTDGSVHLASARSAS